jgi:23S rRNA pseudouridine1911/1915/1917 synthase
MRLSVKLTDIYGISRRNAKKYITDGKVQLNGRVMRKDVEIADEINIQLNINSDTELPDIKEFLISQNTGIIFLYKPPFMHSERHTPEDDITIEDLVPNGFKLISRLDHETDGIIVAVSEDYTINQLHKVYVAAVEGDFPKTLFMDNKIDAAKRKKVKVLADSGGNGVQFRLREHFDNISLVEARLEKANRHQLRAFLAHAGFPIIGDNLYGGKAFSRLMLHCEQTEVNGHNEHSGKYISFKSYLKVT